MKFVLDTHTWFWSLADWHALPPRARTVLSNPRHAPFGLAAISLWELAKLVEKGRITLTIPVSEWIRRAQDPDLITILPLTGQVAIDSTTLPDGFHSDPADELIIATARLHNATLITADKRIQRYGSVKTLWA
ncbi:MAG: Ribonuclease VapC22 [Verrucomicrobia bacterium ADurb.Bin345]|nr:MAG: Ribonuclease VapC22 [Verrucomicrobia bacterium ADurb.Bin345]